MSNGEVTFSCSRIIQPKTFSFREPFATHLPALPFFLLALVQFSAFSFFLLVQKEREKEKGPPKTNAPHVLGITLRCSCVEYAWSVVSAIAHDGAIELADLLAG